MQRIVRVRAEISGDVIFTDHARERMDERGFTDGDVLTTLRKGGIYDTPFRNESGDWQVEVERRMPGGRDAVAITVVPHGTKLVVRTVMWRDEQ